jgi:hypothetical protein
MGAWRVTEITTPRGASLATITHVDIVQGSLKRLPAGAAWVLSGSVRNTRHVTREEFVPAGQKRVFVESVPTCAALIAIRRSNDWWQLGHSARREILETRQPPRGLRYLSAMIRSLQYRRDLSEQFDVVTWFEYEPRDSHAFEDLLEGWRASDEWRYIDRECDIRLVRES